MTTQVELCAYLPILADYQLFDHPTVVQAIKRCADRFDLLPLEGQQKCYQYLVTIKWRLVYVPNNKIHPGMTADLAICDLNARNLLPREVTADAQVFGV